VELGGVFLRRRGSCANAQSRSGGSPRLLSTGPRPRRASFVLADVPKRWPRNDRASGERPLDEPRRPGRGAAELVVDLGRDAHGDFAVRVAGDEAPTRALRPRRDRLPATPGFEPPFGGSVILCPYCDRWQFRGKCLAASRKGSQGMALARVLLARRRSVVWLADGQPALVAAAKGARAAFGIHRAMAPRAISTAGL
jgi:hypothetical protein